MKNNLDTEKLTEQTMNSLNGLQPLEANDFLYAKVVNRIRTGEINERQGYQRLLLKLSVALTLFVCLNGVSFYVLEKRQRKAPQPATIGAAAFAEEYSLKNNSYSY